MKRRAAVAHPNCVLCGPSNENGIRLDFCLIDAGGVCATFGCDSKYEGYPGVVHGGIVASLMDSAMTNCLFMRDTAAVTLRLTVRYRYPVLTERNATVNAHIERSSSFRHVLKAEVVQDGIVKATAEGRFLEQPHLLAAEQGS